MRIGAFARERRVGSEVKPSELSISSLKPVRERSMLWQAVTASLIIVSQLLLLNTSGVDGGTRAFSVVLLLVAIICLLWGCVVYVVRRRSRAMLNGHPDRRTVA